MLEQLLHIEQGVTAIIGGGGKTTLLYALAQELREKGRVIVCTTTHIYPPAHLPCLTQASEAEIAAELSHSGCICVGARDGEKLTAPTLSFAVLRELADYVLTEADGSRGRPLKAHAPHEPVIPPEAVQTVLVLGMSGIGKTIREAAHRPELYAGKLGTDAETVVTPELAARFLNLEGLHDRVFLNQTESAQDWANARTLAGELACPVCAGALQKGEAVCLF